MKQLLINPASLYFQYLCNVIKNKLKFSKLKQGYCSMIHDSHLEDSITLYRNVEIHRSIIGRHTYISSNTRIINCRIGRFCSIASECYMGMPSHPVNRIGTHPVFFSSFSSTGLSVFKKSTYEEFPSTIIGNDVWVGAGAKIKGGVIIGHGAVIGAGAVVVGDVAPYAVYGGIPAKLIKMRFPKNIIERLISSGWWDRSDEEIKKMANKNIIWNVEDESGSHMIEKL